MKPNRSLSTHYPTAGKHSAHFSRLAPSVPSTHQHAPAVCFSALAFVLIASAAPVSFDKSDPVKEVPSPLPSEQLGSAPIWGAALAAGTFSTVNLQTGNLQTGLPILSHSRGLGPVAEVAFVHNSGAIGLGSSTQLPLGEGWMLELLSTLDLADLNNIAATFGNGNVVHFNQGVCSPGYFMSLDQLTATRWRISTGGGEFVYEVISGNANLARLVEVTDELGETLTVQYASTGSIHKLVEASGREIVFVDTNADGVIESLYDSTDPTGTTISLNYTGGRLTSFADSSGVGLQLSYELDGKLDWLENGFDNGASQPSRWNYYYDTSDRVESIFSNSTGASTMSLSYSGSTTTLENALGVEFEYEFDGLGRLIRSGYPLMGDTTYEYNGNHQRTKVTNPESDSWVSTYDVSGHLTRVTDPNGSFVYFVYNAAHHLIELGDANGPDATLLYGDSNYPSLITGIVLPPDGLGKPVATTVLSFYPPSSSWPGMIQSVTDPNGVKTEYTYNALGLVEEIVSGAGFARPVRSQMYYDASGVLFASQDYTADLTAVDPAGFPQLPPTHPAIVSSPTRTSLPTFNWAGQQASATTLYTSGIHPTGWLNAEATASTTTQMVFDYLGRVLATVVVDEQPTVDQALPAIQRIASQTFQDEPMTGLPFGGALTQSASSVSRLMEMDELGRIKSISSTDQLSMTYEYLPDGMLSYSTINHGTGFSRQAYTYDASNKPTSMSIEFSTDGTNWTTQRKIEWIFTVEGLLNFSLEYHFGSLVSGTEYTYDAREQLVWEKRLGLHAYNRFYVYDQGGNRTDMLILNSLDQIQEHHYYTYDVSDTATYLSKANRLMKEVHKDATDSVLRTRYYYYDDRFGNVREVVTKEANDPWHRGVSLVYLERPGATLRSTVSYILERSWIADGSGAVIPNTLTWDRAREMRQEGASDRYLFAERDPVTLELLNSLDSRIWTDRKSAAAFDKSDYQVNPITGAVSNLESMLDSVGQSDGVDSFWFAHDLAGNTRWWLSDTGVYHDEVQTAYGERISTGTPFASRYAGFSGAVGAEEGLLPLGWKRIGARLYDPGSGRWMQRDPIGLTGGINEYEYVANNPTMRNDPSGFQGPAPTVNPNTPTFYPGQEVTFTNGMGTYTVTMPQGPTDYGPPAPPVDAGYCPGTTRPPGTPQPKWWPTHLKTNEYYWRKHNFGDCPFWPAVESPAKSHPDLPTAGAAPDPVPVQEISTLGKVLIKYTEMATGAQKKYPGRRSAFNFPTPVKLP